jgi:glycerol kinase
MKDVILSIDQGTTGSTALFLDTDVRVVAAKNCEFPNHYPKPGWVEHDVREIWESVTTSIAQTIAAAPPHRIRAIGITNQRETCLFWDKETGEPIHRALVWQDRRTAPFCLELKERGLEEMVRAKTGLVLDPYFSGTKAKWMLDSVDGARMRAEKGEILFGTIDTWLIWRLCGAHVTDPSNASRTLLYNIETQDWDDELLELFSIPRACLPSVVDNASIMGHTKGLLCLPDGIPISGVAGDQQSALFGQACFETGEAKCTYGTGAFVLMNTGEKRIMSQNRLLTTIAWRLNGVVTYALEGSAFVAGAAVQWLRDGMGIIDSALEIEELATSVDSSNGVSFVPALAGLGAPHWKPEARGLLSGITGGTTKAHVARAVLEGVALQNVDILDAMSADAQCALKVLKVDGGMSNNNFLMQFQSDVLGVDCVRPTVLETTALGAAFLAGLGVGIWSDPRAVHDAWKQDALFSPNMDVDQKEIFLLRWQEAVSKA